MAIFFMVLVVLASIIISFFILVQNPKGGGLSGSIAGFNSQFMGVKQTTDVLEKGTWVMAVLIAVLSITSPMFISGKSSVAEPNLRPNSTQSAPVTPPPALPQQTPLPAQP